LRTSRLVIAALGALLLANCSSVPAGRQSSALPSVPAPRVSHAPVRPLGDGTTGVASYYSAGGLTAAHRTLPFGTKVRVTNVANGKSVLVRINDRGPFIRGRSIDLSNQAAEAVGMTHAGLAQVRMEVIR
jgi:rare lipoprotein A